MNMADKAPPPGAEGTDQGNGNASEYLSTPDSAGCPVESQLSSEEKKVLNEATREKKTDKAAVEKTVPADDNKDKKERGFFNRLFGGKNRDKEDNKVTSCKAGMSKGEA